MEIGIRTSIIAWLVLDVEIGPAAVASAFCRPDLHGIDTCQAILYAMQVYRYNLSLHQQEETCNCKKDSRRVKHNGILALQRFQTSRKLLLKLRIPDSMCRLTHLSEQFLQSPETSDDRALEHVRQL